jgi:hypothetical protein
MHAIETKAQALAAFLTGEPVRTVMAELRIPRSTAWRWWGEARQWLHELGRLHGLSEGMPRWPRGVRIGTCCATTRSGERCQNYPMVNGRCRMHGGASPRGAAHPRWKHGKYSKYTEGMCMPSFIDGP